MIPGIARRARLHADPSLMGIDYLFVDNTNQTDLYIHFISPPSAAQQAQLAAQTVSILATQGDAPSVPVESVDFPVVNGELTMRVRTAAPGGFGRYTLTLASPEGVTPVLDPYLAAVDFSFKAGCYSDVDCDHSAHKCGQETPADFPVDYEARDFWSMRTALLDFASQRYPRWADRLEADAAVMLVELMSAVADEFAYNQDRIAREAYLETATQRRSLRRHARLVDYRIHDGLGADTRIAVTAKTDGALPAGTTVYAVRDGVRVNYSIGRDLDEMLSSVPKSYAIKVARNEAGLIPYQWDTRDTCLAIGTTALYLAGDVKNALEPFDDTQPDKPLAGRWLLLRTEPEDPGQPPRRQFVRVIKAEVVHDPLAEPPRIGVTTRIEWEPEQALANEFDLRTLHVHGNIVPAVAGEHVDRTFIIGPGGGNVPSAESVDAAESVPNANDPPEPTDPAWAVERTGPDGALTFLFSLFRTDTDGLVWRAPPTGPRDPRLATPELWLIERVDDGAGGYVDGSVWSPKSSLLDAPASDTQARDYILDDGFWRRVVGYQRLGAEFVHIDYSADRGSTIRFGDGTFGRVPKRGTRFRANYLVGNGRSGNLPAGALKYFTQTTAAADTAVKSVISAIDNPFPIENGLDAETPGEIRQLAPEAFRALTFRAVRPEDYAEAAERLTWVQRAGCSFRWTGSWQTAFVTPDPRASVEVSAAQRVELARQLDRFRQAGRETSTLDPRYADLDLRIDFCVARDSYAAEVKVGVAAALTGSPAAFFSPDNFTFGTPLDRSQLEAATQDVAGVRAVEGIEFRRRGSFDWRRLPMSYLPGRNEVIRVENDPTHPDRGSIRLEPDGGA